MPVADKFHAATERFAAWAKDGGHQAGAAILLIAALMAARLGHEIVREPTLIYLPFFALIGLAVISVLLVLGGIGWLFLRVLPALIRFVVKPKEGQKLTFLDIAYGAAAAIFLGVPAISDAAAWWQEHVLKRISGEEAQVAWVNAAAERYFDDFVLFVLGLAILVALATFFFRRVFQQFDRTRAIAGDIARQMLTGRRWQFPIAVLGLFALTVAAWNQYDEQWLGVASSVEMFVLLAWLVFPLRWFLLTCVAVGGPAFVIAAHWPARGFTYTMIVVFWLIWLVSIMGNRWRYWFVPYWLVVLAMAAFLIVDDVYLWVPV